jgi:hypothetical protein
MIDKANVSKIVRDYIKALEGNQFQDFCNRLLFKLYPDEYTPVRAGGPKGDMKNDGYCFVSRKFFQAHASRGETIAVIKNKIQTDLEGCLEKQIDVREFIYLTNDTLVGEAEAFVDSLRKGHQNISIETWGPEKLAITITTLDVEDIEYITEVKLTPNQTNTYLVQINSQENDYGIIGDILQYLFNDIIKTKELHRVEDTERLKKLHEKIRLNFTKANQQAVNELLQNNWKRKELVEQFIKEQIQIDEYPIIALKEYIQDKFRNITSNESHYVKLEHYSIFERIALTLLQPAKITNPDYIANAKAVVLYFFEFCDIGEKTGKEMEEFTQGDLFLGME